jgi:4-hydroxybenzoate polyprenyltransferase
MRLEKPTGSYYFYFPHLFGTLHAAALPKAGLLHLLRVNLIFAVGTIFLRGAACTWNDTIDAPFDRLVVRCRHRPVARRAISIFVAHVFTAVQSLIAFALLNQLPPLCFLYSLPAVAMWAFYPFAKRVTDYPQAVLGFAMAWGVIMGEIAMGIDLFNLERITARTGFPTANLKSAIGCLFAANVTWPLVYDTIYGHQDAKDDAKVGVKNIVLAYRGKTMPLFAKMIIMQTLLLAMTGLLTGARCMYFLLSVVGAAITMTVMVSFVDFNSPQSCLWWFQKGCWLTAGIVGSGLYFEYRRLMGT